jgi:DNA-binding response OmpR family regulator
MSRLLIIEDELMLRSSMVRGITKIPSLEIDDVMTVQEALDVIDASPPDLIISDIDLPDRSGLELLGELGKRGLSVPVIYVTAYLMAYGSQIPPHANVQVLEKPVPLEELRAAVRQALGRQNDDTPFAAADYVQLACLGRHSVLITVSSASEHGEIHILNGEVWCSRDQDGDGTEAFARLAFHNGGEVTCHTLLDDPPERNLQSTWEALLMDSARVLDERGRKPAADPAADPFADLESELDSMDFEAVAVEADEEDSSSDDTSSDDVSGQWELPARRFEDLWDDGVQALLNKDYGAALELFLEARQLRPDDPRVTANIQRLAELGHTSRSSEQ